MFSKIVTSAMFAGFCAGLIAALLQLAFVQPVMLHAELYEVGDLVHFGANVADNPARPIISGIDWGRDLFSVLFTTLVYAGYALVLTAGIALAADRGYRVDARAGLLWGLAGFATFQLAPAFSIPPELPGSSAADITPRQIWWWGCAIATALALGLFASGRGLMTLLAGAVLLLLPHVIGAPQPDAFSGPVPPELASLFAARALATGLTSWAVMGVLAAYFWRRANPAT